MRLESTTENLVLGHQVSDIKVGIRYAVPNTLYSMSRTILNASDPAEVAKEYGQTVLL